MLQKKVPLHISILIRSVFRINARNVGANCCPNAARWHTRPPGVAASAGGPATAGTDRSANSSGAGRLPGRKPRGESNGHAPNPRTTDCGSCGCRPDTSAPGSAGGKGELRGGQPRTAGQLRIDRLGKPGTIVHIDAAPIGRSGPLNVTITHIIHKPDTGLTHADLHVEQLILTQRQRMVAQTVVEQRTPIELCPETYGDRVAQRRLHISEAGELLRTALPHGRLVRIPHTLEVAAHDVAAVTLPGSCDQLLEDVRLPTVVTIQRPRAALSPVSRARATP